MKILITGANRGIGAALKTRLETDGHEVIGTGRQPCAGLVQADVTDAASLKALAGGVGALDMLICNAGIYADKGKALDTYTPQDWLDTMTVNVTGVFLTVQALLPNLRQSATPKIAILSSKMGSTARAPGGAYAYRASKAAVTNLGRNLAADLKSEGIAVGLYHPGWVRTEMGGAEADISVDESISGLTDRFMALDLATTGCFEAYDGTKIAY